MPVESPSLNTLAKAILSYEDGDIMALSRWIVLLESAKDEVDASLTPAIDADIEWVRSLLRGGTIPGFLEEAGVRLDALQAPRAALTEASPLEQHGPAFVSETLTRLSRAEELVLQLEQSQEKKHEKEALDELFRIVHTVKGEAGFLHLSELMAASHTLENQLDGLRNGAEVWSETTGDALLEGFDAMRSLLPVFGARGPRAGAARQEILRVPAEKIEALVSMVGELLVAVESGTNQGASSIRKLGKSLQREALKLRTEPLRAVFGRLRRGVRDLSHDLGKSVDFQVSGEGLELDRNLIANLEEPLMHLIRNAMDHGIDAEAERLEAGKPAIGVVRLEASRRGNRIAIVLTDDGRGLNPDKIWARACRTGLASGPMPEREAVFNLVFQPGFSTAESLTNVSGRGVGMDVVATMVKDNRGRVKLESEPGRGTSVTLTFPLSTAVMEGVVVRQGAQRYLVPIQSVEETLFLRREALDALSAGSRVFSLRNLPLPVFLLEELLRGRAPEALPSWGIVVAGDAGRYLVLVDEVESQREVVIRSLGPAFRRLGGIPAATILAGGALALVLDLDHLTEGVRP